jgi:uncharacterized membrane protein
METQTRQTHHGGRDAAECVERALFEHERYWHAQVVVAAAILLDLSLPQKLTLGPSWLLPGVEGVLLIGLMIATPNPRVRHSPHRRQFAIALISIVSAVNAWSLALLCHYLIHGGDQNGRRLILSGVVLWVTNVLLFGLWYWELDRGGPVERMSTPERYPDFMFPQLSDPKLAPPNWMPKLVDYLYVSFTNATAFSPTDTMPLTANAKVLMGGQSIIALVTIGLVVARAVNILPATA